MLTPITVTQGGKAQQLSRSGDVLRILNAPTVRPGAVIAGPTAASSMPVLAPAFIVVGFDRTPSAADFDAIVPPFSEQLVDVPPTVGNVYVAWPGPLPAAAPTFAATTTVFAEWVACCEGSVGLRPVWGPKARLLAADRLPSNPATIDVYLTLDERTVGVGVFLSVGIMPPVTFTLVGLTSGATYQASGSPVGSGWSMPSSAWGILGAVEAAAKLTITTGGNNNPYWVVAFEKSPTPEVATLYAATGPLAGLPLIGQATMVNSLPVVIASDQSPVPTKDADVILSTGGIACPGGATTQLVAAPGGTNVVRLRGISVQAAAAPAGFAAFDLRSLVTVKTYWMGAMNATVVSGEYVFPGNGVRLGPNLGVGLFVGLVGLTIDASLLYVVDPT